MGRLADKNILITGGNSGIGLAAAQEFDREGARVAICGSNETVSKWRAYEIAFDYMCARVRGLGKLKTTATISSRCRRPRTTSPRSRRPYGPQARGAYSVHCLLCRDPQRMGWTPYLCDSRRRTQWGKYRERVVTSERGYGFALMASP